jgi:nickel/cobalt exporter
MSDLMGAFNAGAADAWVFVPTAILLGALHGLEPGHSKTMMAAFIVAVRGTVGQAALLALAATISHTAVVWVVALGGMYLGAKWNVNANEPYLQIVSALLILIVAAWMTWRIWRDRAQQAEASGHAPHDHGRAEHRHARGFDRHGHARPCDDDHRGGAVLTAETAAERKFEDELRAIEPDVYADAHEREHALEIERRFGDRQATTGQIILFGLTSGLIPCPASITVLLLCLQVGRLALGAALVLCFSVGLALTLVFVGVAAALGVRQAVLRWPGVASLASRAPYVSSALVALVGVYTLWLGAAAIP